MERFIRLPDVIAQYGIARSTLYHWISGGRFPRPVPLGQRAVGWSVEELNAWTRERIAERDNLDRKLDRRSSAIQPPLPPTQVRRRRTPQNVGKSVGKKRAGE